MGNHRMKRDGCLQYQWDLDVHRIRGIYIIYMGDCQQNMLFVCGLLKCHDDCGGRSGKSSIQKVVFHKVSPNETLFLESTNKIVKDGEESSACYYACLWI